jgi:hypothetical protein
MKTIILSIILAATMAQAGLRELATQRTDRPDKIGNIQSPNEETLIGLGWRHEPAIPPIADGYVRQSIRLVEGDGRTGQWEVVDRLQAQLDAEAAAAEQARIVGLAQSYGQLVGALAAYLARVGWSIPCEAAVVTADLLQRDLSGQLTADQKDAKANVADAYMLLTAAGLSNADIAAVWRAVKP